MRYIFIYFSKRNNSLQTHFTQRQLMSSRTVHVLDRAKRTTSVAVRLPVSRNITYTVAEILQHALRSQCPVDAYHSVRISAKNGLLHLLSRLSHTRSEPQRVKSALTIVKSNTISTALSPPTKDDPSHALHPHNLRSLAKS